MIKSFNIVIYNFYKNPAVLLIDIETTIISAFSFSSLFYIKTKQTNKKG